METVTDLKNRIRMARALMLTWRTRVNSCRTRAETPACIELPFMEFEALEWGMAHLLKAWLPASYDAEGEPRPPWRLVRLHGLYRQTGTENFLFKGIPVRRRHEERVECRTS